MKVKAVEEREEERKRAKKKLLGIRKTNKNKLKKYNFFLTVIKKKNSYEGFSELQKVALLAFLI